MFWTKARYFILGFAVALVAAVATPVMAGAYVVSHLDAGAAPAVKLACSTVDTPADVYAPTGEPIDTTIVVSAPAYVD